MNSQTWLQAVNSNPNPDRLENLSVSSGQGWTIDAREISIGKNVVIEPGVTIGGIGGPADRVVIGDNTYLGANTKIRVPELQIGDYARINNHALIYGYCPTYIGHNAWFGQNIILNSTDTLIIGNNCCIGAYSQLWTHFQFGDLLEGCRFNSTAPMRLGNDVWISGNCVVSPITAEDRSMAMPGSVVTSDMKYNRVYAGNPARDMTDRLGHQFKSVSIDEKAEHFKLKLREFFQIHPEFDETNFGILAAGQIISPGEIIFNLDQRTYTKSGSAAEIALMIFLLPKIKFTPA